MQSYTVVLRNAHGRVISRFEFGCPDDEEAELIAQEEARGRAAELWSGERRIAVWPMSRERRGQNELAASLREPLPVPQGAAVIATSLAGLVCHWDRNAARLYGWSASEALGRNIVEVTPAIQSRLEAAEVMRCLQAGQSWAGEMVLRRKDGRPFRAFILDVPLAPAGARGGGIVGISLPVEASDAVRAARDAIELELERRFAPSAGRA